MNYDDTRPNDYIRSYYAMDNANRIHVWFDQTLYNATIRANPRTFYKVPAISKEVQRAIRARQVIVHSDN